MLRELVAFRSMHMPAPTHAGRSKAAGWAPCVAHNLERIQDQSSTILGLFPLSSQHAHGTLIVIDLIMCDGCPPKRMTCKGATCNAGPSCWGFRSLSRPTRLQATAGDTNQVILEAIAMCLYGERTIAAKIITVLTRYRPIVLELIKTVIKNKFLAGNIPVIKSSLSFFWVWEGGRRGGGREPTAVHLPCARSHSNASMLAAVLVDRFFP